MSFKGKIAGVALSLSLLLGGGVMASQSAEYDRITEDMAALRQLELLQPLDIEMQTRAELREWLAESLAEYPEHEQADDQRVLEIFGLIEPGTDIRELQSEILGEQIAGYYDPEIGAMVVVRSDEGDELSANDELTFAHEVVHALQDQHFDLLAVQGDLDEISDDQYLAVSALIEGDASVGQVLYLIENPSLLRAVQGELENFESPSLDAAPLFFMETLLFPYDQGAKFVAAIYDTGDWAAVDAMYENPPVSTEQILHPEKYLEGEMPIDVSVQDPTPDLGEGWVVLDDNVMGQFITDVFLRNGGASASDAQDASEGWGGDAYVVVGNEEEAAFTWTSVWDTEDDADEFFNVLVGTEIRRLGAEVEQLGDASHLRISGGGYVGEIHLDGNSVIYALAETEETLDVLTGR
jgi:hypothetical protein